MPCQVCAKRAFEFFPFCWSLQSPIVKVKLPQYAWDGDPNTVWHPTGSGEGAYTTLHLNEVSSEEKSLDNII